MISQIKFFKKENFEGITLYRIWTYQPSTKNPSFLGRLFYYTIFPILTNLFLFRFVAEYLICDN